MVLPSQRPLRCAITDLSPFRLDAPADRRLRLEAQLRQWAVDGVDFVQLREKDLKAADLFALARAAARFLREGIGATNGGSPRPRLLVNGRPDIAVAAGADGVHLPAAPGALTPVQVKSVFAGAGRPESVVSLSCHTLAEVAAAQANGADFILFGPVYEKRVGGAVVVEGKGVDLLRQACLTAGSTPVLALGGVTAANMEACLQAGAAGVAAIRLFA